MSSGQMEHCDVLKSAVPMDKWRTALCACVLIIGSGVTDLAYAQADRLAVTSEQIFIVGHRGAMRGAPENTIAAHELALQQGANIIELDVRMTKDGHFVVIHDPTVNRTTNGRGRVSHMTLAEIKTLDAGSWKGPQFAGERVPTLEEALANLKGRAGVEIDFKGGRKDAGTKIADILDAQGYNDGTLVTVFARSSTYNKLRGVIGRYQLRPLYQDANWARRTARKDNIEIVGLRRYGYNKQRALDITDQNFTLFLNLMGGKEGRKAFKTAVRSGAKFVQTNNVPGLHAYLTDRGLYANCVPAVDLSCWQPQQLAQASPTSMSGDIEPPTAVSRNFSTTR